MYRQTKSARVAVILMCTIIARAQQAGGDDEPPRPAQQTMSNWRAERNMPLRHGRKPL